MSIVAILLLLNLLVLSTNGLRMTFQETLDEPTASSAQDNQQNDADLKWTQLEILNEAPEKRRGHTSIVLGSEFMVFGGCYLDQKCFNDLHSFDTRTKIWTQQRINGIPPSQREGHSVAVVGSKMYLFGGSGSSSYYNDLFIFDLETKTWVEVNYQGPKPTPRSNHGAVVDKKGRIIIFGGFTENGFSNDVYILDPVEEKWQKPYVSGQAPVPRESFSMTRVRNTIWIFGGFTDGGILGDLSILDLDSMAWNIGETFGSKPPGRQGHGAILHEKNFIMFGGCNYKIKTCYSDMYYLDIDSLWWKKISDDRTAKFTPRESFSTNVIGAMVYVFGGCKLYEECYNDVLAYNTNVPCPNSCSSNGECRNDQCVCNQGFFDNDCSLAVRCKDDCSGHGECHSNGKCACFSGFAGESCNTVVSCPGNCTSPDNGICLQTGQCKCFSGFSGDSCETGSAVAMDCPKNCSKHGECDKRTGICICQKFYTGDDCAMSLDEAQLAEAELGVKAQELAAQEESKSITTVEKAREEIQQQIAEQIIKEEGELNKGEVDGLKAIINAESKTIIEGGNNEEEDFEYDGSEASGGQGENVSGAGSAETETTETSAPETAEATEENGEEEVEDGDGDEDGDEGQDEDGDEDEDDEDLESLMQRTAKEGKTENLSEERVGQPLPIALLDAKLQQSTTTSPNSNTMATLAEQLQGGGEQTPAAEATDSSDTDDEEFQNRAVENLTPEMFADAYAKERKIQERRILATDAESSMCPNSCSHNGLCRGDKCYCSNGYTGEDCSISNVQDLKEGETVENVLKYAAVCFIIGAVLGIFLIVALIRKAQESEYMNIQPKVEEED